MNATKSDSVHLLAKEPERALEQESQQQLAFERMVQRGSADSDAGRTSSHEAIRNRIASWHL